MILLADSLFEKNSAEYIIITAWLHSPKHYDYTFLYQYYYRHHLFDIAVFDAKSRCEVTVDISSRHG